MADLRKFWQRERCIWTSVYDQKAMLAREMIATEFRPDDADKLEEIINYFAQSEKAAISLMGVLAQVGIAAMAIDDSTGSSDTNGEP